MGPSCQGHACFGAKNLNRHEELEQRSSRMAWWVKWVGLAVGALVLDCGSDSTGTPPGAGTGTSSSAATSTGAGPTSCSTSTGVGTSGRSGAATTTGGGHLTGAGGST